MLNPFLSTVYSEEIFDFTEEEYAAVMSDASDYEGYAEWSTELEQGEVIETERGAILFNRECSHSTCKTTKCERGATFEGIAI